MANFTTSIKLFTSLSRAPGAVWTEATKRKAPHKPLLLLAVQRYFWNRIVNSRLAPADHLQVRTKGSA